jgi:hypothetical protein
MADQLRAARESRPSSAPVINIWYGDNQSFGQIGSPQPMINILGNATAQDGIASLTMSLNGEPSQMLSLGCNLYRLAHPGDFNAEIDRRALSEGANVVEIVATDSSGGSCRKKVTVNYAPGTSWPLPYSIDWSRVNNIQDVAQIIDGHWLLDSTGVRSAFPYYDRVIAMGDNSWKDYEAMLTVTWNCLPVLNNKGGAPYQDHAHASICLRWQGHDNDGRRPLRKWWPLGGLAGLTTRADSPDKMQWYFWKGDGSRHLMGDSTRAMVVGRPYTYRVRVETLPDSKSRYSMKAWDAASETEPHDWDMVVDENEQDLRSGTLLFVVHHGDVTFGNITVAPIAD